MNRRLIAGMGALAVAVLLMAADPASAQRGRRGGFSAGYSPYTGFNAGYSTWDGGWGYGRGWGGYPGYYDGGYYSRWNQPYYSSPGYYYSGNPAFYDNTSTGYYDNTTGNQLSSNNLADFGTGGDTSVRTQDNRFGTQMNFTMNDRNVLIEMQVPPNAEVFFDDQKTSQTGPFRSFISPPLNPDQNFVYHVRIKWNENGRDVERKRRIDVHAGDRLMVNFMRPGDRERFYGSERSGQFYREDMNRNNERPGARDRDRDRDIDRSLENRRGTENRDIERSPTDTTRDPRTRTTEKTNPNDTTRPSDTNRPPNDTSRPPH